MSEVIPDPELFVRHRPVVSLKQPFTNWMPFEKVLVAVVLVRLSTVAFSAWRLVEVPVTELSSDPPSRVMPLNEERPPGPACA